MSARKVATERKTKKVSRMARAPKGLFIFGRKVPASAIVPAKMISPKQRKAKVGLRVGDPFPSDHCSCLPVGGLTDGQWINYDGNPIFVAVPTTGGGPWALAQYSNGQPVWVNLGGL